MNMNGSTASIIMAAGRDSRMKGYSGNKTLLPLVPSASPFSGEWPLLANLISNLPEGPKAIVVNHCKDDVMAAAAGVGACFCEQPVLNGTGGAIIAARGFISAHPCDSFLITMGDVPFVKAATYRRMVQLLSADDIVMLGFRPVDRKQYGVLEIESGQVTKITEWKYWKDYPEEKRASLTVCNAGIYAVSRRSLETYLPVLAGRPQIVTKEIAGRMTEIEEFFITDLVEYMVADGRRAGFLVAEDETETMGVDDLEALQRAQTLFRSMGR